MPTAQLVQAGAAAPEYLPSTQSTQLSDDAAPVVSRDCPAAQLEQLAVPELDAYWPAAQPTQLVDAALPVTVRYSPAAHAVHAAAPPPEAYEPAAQLAQAAAPPAA